MATISCTGGCGVDTRTVTFLDCLNAKTGSDRYEQLLDVNGDGIITPGITCCWIASSTLLNKDGQNSKKKRTTRIGGPFSLL